VVCFRLNSGSSVRIAVFRTLAAVTVLLSVTTGVFIYVWARLATYSPDSQRFIKYVLVQGHLATENVLAAWLSSMLLLSVGLLAIAAFVADGRSQPGWLRFGWLGVATAFVLLSFDEIGSFHERVGTVGAFGGSAERPMEWVYVLAVPIALVAGFLAAFAWLHVRASPTAFWLIISGVALFAANPAVERVEMLLLDRGAAADTPERLLHDVLLVFEEGLLELFGALCFASGVLAYLDRVSRGRFEWCLTPRRAVIATGGLMLWLAAGVPVARELVNRMPAGDTGIAANWFPAAACFLLAATCALRQPGGRRLRLLGLFALIASAYFGAGIYGYTSWGVDISGPEIPVAATIAAGAVMTVVVGTTGAPASSARIAAR
jgi:hypothetical protein